MAGPVGGLRKHPHGRVDQLEDRYLGMVEAPSSNLGTSTRNESKQVCWTVRHDRFIAKHLGRWLGTSTIHDSEQVWWSCAKTVVLLIASIFGSARPPFYRFISRVFFGMFGTSTGPNHWVSVDRTKDDCRLHSADDAERNRNDGNGFLSTVFHNDRTSEPWR